MRATIGASELALAAESTTHGPGVREHTVPLLGLLIKGRACLSEFGVSERTDLVDPWMIHSATRNL